MNTRFNPTANGNIHIGHLYIILLNYYTAKSQGGKFICRFDDDQPYNLHKFGKEKIDHYCESTKEDLDWLRIPAVFTYESKEKEANEAILHNQLGNIVAEQRILESTDFTGLDESAVREKFYPYPSILGQESPYPYVPYLTAVKVAQDYRENINPIIRGDELTSEFSLYCYFCQVLNVPVPQMLYVPRLMRQTSGELVNLTDISKTKCNLKIKDFRDQGYSPENLIEAIGKFCLIDSKAGWSFENIKKQPVVEIDNE